MTHRSNWSLAKQVAAGVLGAICFAAEPQAQTTRPEPQVRVYFDNDFMGPGQSNIQAVIPLLREPNVQIAGIGVVTGDAWLEEETAHLLRFLEIAGRPDVPVYRGADMPLIRTQAELRAWEARYGRVPWKGAWNPPRAGRSYHPDDPHLIPPMPEGTPSLAAASEAAAVALSRMVHESPNTISIIAAGPLTNIALAVRLDPELPKLAKEIVIQGGYLDNAMARVTANADYGTDFNFIFDPEAAHIVLNAPWQRITIVGDVTTPIKMTEQLVSTIGQSKSAVAQYVKTFARIGQPLWDEITVAIALDKSLIKREVTARMDVDILPGPTYGQAQVWTNDLAPGAGEQTVHIVQEIDSARFLKRFMDLAAQ